MHPKSSKNTPTQAFTLIELSIVIVIIGLLIGGILGGQSLIRSSELQSVLSDLSKIKSAVTQFKDQYGALPGDLADDTDYWGSAGGTGLSDDTNCTNNIPSTQNTCNGPNAGNMGIDYVDGSSNHWPSGFMAWQHMSKAGLIVGKYTGVGNGGTLISAPGINVYPSRIKNVGYTFTYLGTIVAINWGEYQGTYNNLMYLGTAGNLGAGNFLTPTEAWNIDTKIDDGRPGLGAIYTWRATGCTDDTDATHGATANYALTTQDKVCNLNWKTGY